LHYGVLKKFSWTKKQPCLFGGAAVLLVAVFPFLFMKAQFNVPDATYNWRKAGVMQSTNNLFGDSDHVAF